MLPPFTSTEPVAAPGATPVPTIRGEPAPSVQSGVGLQVPGAEGSGFTSPMAMMPARVGPAERTSVPARNTAAIAPNRGKELHMHASLPGATGARRAALLPRHLPRKMAPLHAANLCHGNGMPPCARSNAGEKLGAPALSNSGRSVTARLGCGSRRCGGVPGIRAPQVDDYQCISVSLDLRSSHVPVGVRMLEDADWRQRQPSARASCADRCKGAAWT